MAWESIKDSVENILKDFLKEKDLSLYKAEFVREGKDRYLRVIIDKPWTGEERYISTDDCELVSRFLSEKLDELDIIPDNYYLEVSSPGLDRALIKEEDYVRFKGRTIEVALYEPYLNKKKHTGKLLELKDDCILIEYENEKLSIPVSKVAKAKLKIEC